MILRGQNPKSLPCQPFRHNVSRHGTTRTALPARSVAALADHYVRKQQPSPRPQDTPHLPQSPFRGGRQGKDTFADYAVHAGIPQRKVFKRPREERHLSLIHI